MAHSNYLSQLPPIDQMTLLLNDWKTAYELGLIACETNQGLKTWTDNKAKFQKEQILDLNPRYMDLLDSLKGILVKVSDDDMKLHFDSWVLGNQKEEHFVMQMFRIALLNHRDGKLPYQRVMQIAYNIGQFTKACELKMYGDNVHIIELCKTYKLTDIETYICL